MTLPVVRHYKGNTAPSLFYTLRVPVAGATNPDDPSQQQPFPLPAGSTVKFYVRDVSGPYLIDGADAVIVNPAATTPTDPDAGRLRYDWTADDVSVPGEYVAWFRIFYPGGTVQDTPEFIWNLSDHFAASPEGLYTSVARLKDFTGLDELKTADDEWLAENVIPRAEAWLAAFGPFVSTTCPGLALASNMLAEAIFERINPRARNTAAAGDFKSESIGNYSYTLGDVAGSATGSTPWDDLMAEIAMVLAPCIVPSQAVLHASDYVFTPLPAYALDPVSGSIARTFDVNQEVEILRGYLDRIVWR